MFRSVLAAIAGLVVANVIVFAVEFTNSKLHPFPPGFDMNDPAQISAFIATLPASAFAVVWVAWVLGAFAGTFVTKQLTPGCSNRPAIVVAVLFFLFCVINMLMVPHPLLFVVGSIVATPLASLLALKLSQKPAIA